MPSKLTLLVLAVLATFTAGNTVPRPQTALYTTRTQPSSYPSDSDLCSHLTDVDKLGGPTFHSSPNSPATPGKWAARLRGKAFANDSYYQTQAEDMLHLVFRQAAGLSQKGWLRNPWYLKAPPSAADTINISSSTQRSSGRANGIVTHFIMRMGQVVYVKKDVDYRDWNDKSRRDMVFPPKIPVGDYFLELDLANKVHERANSIINQCFKV
ncbi:hypothetical protein BJ085DRAFT_38337 [Dimargaris cristalligena]|uniref:Uncharacterized protein n=1 Tax=Dimargaris cristalligena TaxID=215637 RepID=A0A4P9ZVT7_9FUNG|nr:hypothetical protein BJ085DRAFT_38337 [Dimargaris cristalligena]|eukprot:RKP36760.1 hypothetical protein BJ085DRAFT_38337 [Dimargaris cristalligena]